MPTTLQFRRGSTSEIGGIKGLPGEIFVNTDDYSLRVHDNVNPGGYIVPAKTYVDSQLSTKLDASTYTASDVLSKIRTVDGPSSGLDSDLLDNQEGSYYLDHSNFTNVPSPRLTLQGDATGVVEFTNLNDGTLTVTVTDNSHNHLISNISGLQSILDSKVDDTGDTIDGSLTINDNLTVQGDLDVKGTLTSLVSTNTVIKDNLIELNTGLDEVNANDSGVIINRGTSGDNALMIWDESLDLFALGTSSATADDIGDLSYTKSGLISNSHAIDGSLILNTGTNGSDATIQGLTSIEVDHLTLDDNQIISSTTYLNVLSDDGLRVRTSSGKGSKIVIESDDGIDSPTEFDAQLVLINDDSGGTAHSSEICQKYDGTLILNTESESQFTIDGTTKIRLLSSSVEIDDIVDLNGNRIRNVSEPSDDSDSATKFYVDTVPLFNTVEIESDSGYTWGSSPVIADSNAKTLDLIGGIDIDIESDASNDAIRISHSNTSSLNGNYGGSNGNGIVIEDFTVDPRGHVTAIDTVNLDDRYYTESESDSRFINTSGDTMTGFLTLSGEPQNSLHAATKLYVDEIAQGLNTLPSALVATNSDLNATFSAASNTLTSNVNGAINVDSTNLALGENILVKDQTNLYENGSYVVTQVGDASNPWILTRCSFCDETSEIAGSFKFIENGATYAGTGWTAVVPTDFELNNTTASSDSDFTTRGDIQWTQFSGAGTFTAGAGLDLDGTVFSHTDTSSQDSLDSNTQGTVIQNITLDTYGHITGMSTVDLSTDDVDEGSNLYFTTGRIDNHLSGGTGVTYSSGTISIGQPVATNDNVTFNNLSLTGNLTVNGSTSTINTTNTSVSDNLIELNSGVTSNANDSGVIIERGSTGDNAVFVWDESNDNFILGTTTATAADIGSLSITKGELNANVEWSNILSRPSITVGNGLSSSGSLANDNFSISHADTSTQSSLNSNTQRTVIQNIELDNYGHIIGMSTVDLDTQLTGGTGVDYTNGTISIGQPVDETDDVSFSTVSAGSVSADTFDVNQTISLGDHIDIQEAYATKTTSSTDFTIASFSSSIYSSAKLTIEAEDYDTSGNSDIQIQEFLIVSKGADIFMTEYGIVSSTTNPFVTYSAINNGGFIEVDASFSVSGDVNFKTSMTLFKKKPGIA